MPLLADVSAVTHGRPVFPLGRRTVSASDPLRSITSCEMTGFFTLVFRKSRWLPMLSLIIPLLAASATVPSNNGTRLKFDSCLGCICEASSRCNRDLGCDNGVCGLFQITKPYWEDAGSPIVAGDSPFSQGAFERCTTDTFCALETVNRYIQRYAKDCNNNGEVDCHDYALLHHLGVGCEGKPSQQYTEEFENCRFNLVLLNQPV